METNTNHNNLLIEACKRGESQAQLQIYKQYYKAMYNTALRIVGNSYEAEDVMQDSFLAAFSKIESFSGTVTFGAWLKRIVINKSITSFNKNKKTETVSLNENLEIEEEENTSCNYNGLKTANILESIERLKSNYKLAITLHFIEGYDYEEIASIMNISYQNSRTLISRAKAKLKQELMSIKIS